MAHKIILAFVSLLVSAGAFAQVKNSIVGKFKNEDRGDVIFIYQSADSLFYGKNDKGEILLHKVKYDIAAKTWNGVMIPPGKSIKMDVSISVLRADKLKMRVTKFWISTTNILTRVK